MNLEKRVEALEKEIAELKVSERLQETYSDNFVRKLIGAALGKVESATKGNESVKANEFAELAQKLATLL